MEIKQALLDSELNSVKKLLQASSLKLDEDVDLTLYIEEDGKVIATISKACFIIKCIAIDEAYRSENLTSTLLTAMLTKMHEEGIFYYQLFTKPMYEEVFKSLNFKLLVKTDKVLMFEGGNESIYDSLKGIKNQMKYGFSTEISSDLDIAGLVFNANPFTLGHQMLVEQASNEHDYVVVFIVEEDKSEFDFKSRMVMAYLACKRLGNVVVVPSSRYVISSATFPSYFLHDDEEVKLQSSLVDALLFKNYFMKELSIKTRYVGSETKEYMQKYNSNLLTTLEENLVVVDRFKLESGEVISASTVRSLLKEGKLEEACKFIPKESLFIFMGLAKEKYGC